MKTKNVKLYGDIAKSEEQDDGTIKVWGYASSDTKDSDGETITADAMKAALPDYMKFANVREMHTAKAAGVAIEATVQDDGRTFFGAHIIDSEAVKKVRAGVYKGFSIGGKVTSRDLLNKTIINGLRLSEVSLVDRPANPEATFTFFKADSGPGDETNPDDPDGDSGTVTKAGEAAPVVPTVEAVEAVKVVADETVTITKAEHDEFAAYKAEKLQAAKDALFKGMGHVGQLAYTLQSFQYLVRDQQDEAAREGDASPVPAKLQALAEQMGAILIEMTQEEVGELIARITPPDPNLDVDGNPVSPVMSNFAYAAKTDDLEKAGARFSSSTKKVLGDVHGAMKQACTHLDGLGYADKADGPDDLSKMASLTNDLAKMTGERDDLAKQLTALKALPAPTKATLKVVEKSQDLTNPAKVEDDTPKTPEQIMKSIHSGGAMVMTANGLRALTP
jgi:phage head maturation protease